MYLSEMSSHNGVLAVQCLMCFCRLADLPEHAFRVAMKELKVGTLL